MDSDLQSEMSAAANSAVQHAKKLWSTDLDFSPQSIEDVELILARMYETIPHRAIEKLLRKKPSEEQMATIAVSYGAYLGEVIRREFGGTWQTQDVSGQPALALVFDEKNMIFPPAKIWKRLNNGAEDNVWSFYRVFTDMLRDQRAGKDRFPNQDSSS